MNVTWTYHDGDWHGLCDLHWYWPPDFPSPGAHEGTYQVRFEASRPPHWPLFDTTHPPTVGENVTAWRVDNCQIWSETLIFDGQHGARYNASNHQFYSVETEWDTQTGLVLGWADPGYHAGGWGELTSTDAPLSGPTGYPQFANHSSTSPP